MIKQNKIMDTKKMSDEELQGLFDEAFISQVGSYNGITEVESKCIRSLASKEIKFEVTIQGMAGTPTADDFKNGKVKNSKKVTIAREDKGVLPLKLLTSDTVYVNSTEYVVTYKA